jgi:hypothetical protein
MNSLPYQESFHRFEVLFEQIAEKDRRTINGPKIIGEAENLASTVIDAAEATAEDCWTRMWDKPLYANVHTAVAKGWRKKSCTLLSATDAWRGMQKAAGDYQIKKSLGVKRSPENFKAIGGKSQALVDLGVPIERLYSIVCAAEALVKWTNKSSSPLRGVEVDVETVNRLSTDLDYNWGSVTTLHFLTDMGLACKPDMHLNATCRYLGFEITDVDNPSLIEAVEIVNFVKSLVHKMYGEVTSQKLRFVDKCLMEASKRQVIPIMSRYPNEASWLAVEMNVPDDNVAEEVQYRWKVRDITIGLGRSKDPEGELRSDLRALNIILKRGVQALKQNKKRVELYRRILSERSAGRRIVFLVS